MKSATATGIRKLSAEMCVFFLQNPLSIKVVQHLKIQSVFFAG